MIINDPYSIEHLYTQLKKMVDFLTPLLPLANSHLVQFISQDQWNQFLPNEMKQDLLNVPYNKLNLVSTAQLYNISAEVHCVDFESNPPLQKFISTVRSLHADKLGVLSTLSEIKGNISERDDKILEESMNKKKSYEVKHMSRLIATICEDTKMDWIVDVGSGLGYLSSTLLIQHKFNVIAIDSSKSNISSCLKHSQVLFERFDNKRSSSTKCRKQNIKSDDEDDSNMLEEENNSLSFNEFQGKFLGLTKYITKDDDLPELIGSIQINDKEVGRMELGLVGLHTCGNLSPTSLMLFISNPRVQFMCNVGCCYHLLTEEFCEDFYVINQNTNNSQGPLDERYHCPELDPFHRKKEAKSVDAGFPLSSHLKSVKFYLGRNARDLAAKPSNKLSINDKNLEPLFWRALFEQIVLDVNGCWPENARVGRKIGKNSENFSDYCVKSFHSIGLPNKLTEIEFSKYYEKHKMQQDQLIRFFFLKTSLAPLIETLINLDRLIYLMEQGFHNSHLIQIFDSKISPRNTAVVSFK